MMLMTFGAEREAAGKYAGKVELIRGWYNEGSTLPAEEAAKLLRVTPAQFESVLSLIQEKPELDDEQESKPYTGSSELPEARCGVFC